MIFTRGAIVAVVDGRGRVHHAIQIDHRSHATGREGVDGRRPPADRPSIERLMRFHGIHFPRHLTNPDVPFSPAGVLRDNLDGTACDIQVGTDGAVALSAVRR